MVCPLSCLDVDSPAWANGPHRTSGEDSTAPPRPTTKRASWDLAKGHCRGARRAHTAMPVPRALQFDPMRSTDILALFDFTYWADRQILAAAEAVGPEDFTRPVTITYRNLRDTLVHTLDVEASWRRRLRGEPKSTWDTSLQPESYATVGDLAAEWARDEAEMRGWMSSLDDAALGAIQDLGDGDRFPLWYYLVHIVTHSEQQRRDVQIVLRHLGHEPPDLEFLYYADSLGADSG